MLVAISASHGRYALTKLWAEHTVSLGFDRVITAMTEPAYPYDIEFMQRFGFMCFGYPNSPLAGKFNAAMGFALRMGATRIMILPSDDFVSQEWVDAARTSTDDYIIPHACGVYSPATEQAYLIHKFSAGTLRFGAGRVVSRKAVKKCGELWTPTINRGLDTASHHRLLDNGFTHKIVNTSGIPITDVKTSENIWPASTWRPGSRDITTDEALHMVSPSIREQLKKVR